jgi:hypothetical protein
VITIPTSAHPLRWPAAVRRTRDPEPSRFKGATIAGEIEIIRRAVALIGGKNLVISSNVPLKANGAPYSEEPGRGVDAGVAVYWAMPNDTGTLVPHAMPCDRWRTVADNLHAVALSLEAMRGLDRWGAVTVSQAFAGFAALPPGSSETPARDWREVLGAPPWGGAWPADLGDEDTLGLARNRYRRAMAAVHPDRGGTTEQAAEINIALEQCERELTATRKETP